MIPLATARLCSNCEHICDARGEHCPKCGAFANWLSIAKLLSAKPDQVVNIQRKGAAA